ncbi:3'(2'),5'-bisphosphate nucleotidase CysQ [Steroidobacter sp. S1-65]|uniref:3'(2'),5'-bisphosphate nucleotidase CysQ n=1 Tax=Steroidobacter gossypii TaxID=2805490 RepID=A0ABS1WTC0_9GAMM|nr:3'(2'),5'-bisphosphate nucleotidase CysQ [Steroidobacter gossypii]MBM0104211.1 3'(2'),5'-bisphosphate nucleotidase CysQ [Steroidobacter gossypii]
MQAELLTAAVKLAHRAGDAILSVYSEQFDVTHKTDRSPLTVADLRSHDIISRGLRDLTPDVPVLSEEASDISYEQRRQWSRYWLVDPLDGTKEFVSRNGEFTVNIALIENHAPVLGVVHVPVTNTTYTGAVGLGAFRQINGERPEAIRVQAPAASPLRIVGSRSHRGDSLDKYLPTLAPYELIAVGSSLKFCLVAEGSADFYPRFGPTSEWDTAAAQAVVEAAGGAVVKTTGEPLRYNTKPDLLNPHFLVYGDLSRDWLQILALR